MYFTRRNSFIVTEGVIPDRCVINPAIDCHLTLT